MNKVIVKFIMILIIHLLLILHCHSDVDIFNKEADKKKKEKESKANIYVHLYAELKCQTPGAIYTGTEPFFIELYQGRQCLTNPTTSGLIFNYDTKEVIQTGSIPFSAGIRLACNIKNSSPWYKSPVPNPINGQAIVLVSSPNYNPTQKYDPFTSYAKGDVLYCVTGGYMNPSDVPTHQKLIIE